MEVIDCPLYHQMREVQVRVLCFMWEILFGESKYKKIISSIQLTDSLFLILGEASNEVSLEIFMNCSPRRTAGIT